MIYGVTQYGNSFFELIKIKGCSKTIIFTFPQTEITEKEWKKLFYSGERFNRRYIEKNNYSIEKFAIRGNWKEKLK